MYLSQLDTLVGLASSYFMLIMAIRLMHSSTNPSILIHSDYNSSHTDIVSFIKCVFLFYNIPSWMKCLRARRRCLGKCDITVPKVDNILCSQWRIETYLPRKHMGFGKDLVNREMSVIFFSTKHSVELCTKEKYKKRPDLPLQDGGKALFK